MPRLPHRAFCILCGLTLLALAASADDITVLVVEDNESNAAPTPLAGAVVTLQGTDPGSVTGMALTTGAGGTVTFVGVSGPYSVTAQYDYVLPGETIRVATSLVDISPAIAGGSGTIGLWLEQESASGPSTATLSGTILNPPAIVGSQMIEVVAVEKGSGETVGWALGSGGSYSMAIPAGVTVHCYAAHRASFGSSAVLSSVFATGVGPVAAFGSAVQDFDFAAAVPWSVPVAISESGRVPGFDLGIQLLVTEPTARVDFDFSIFDGPTNPGTIMLPSVSSLGSYDLWLAADTRDPFGIVGGEQARGQRLTTTPAAVSFDFMLPPTLVHPVDGDSLSLSELACLGVVLTEGAVPAGFGNNGVNAFFLENLSGTPPPGIDVAGWTIIVPGGTTLVDLPPHTLPMFTAGQVLYSGASQSRFQGYGFDYDSFFDGNVVANLAAFLAAVTEECESSQEIDLSVVADTYCTPGTSAAGCQASLATSGGASATAPSGFVIAATFAEGNKDGLFFFGPNGRQAAPWGNGTSYQCVTPPVKRGGLLPGIGTSGVCNGVFSQDLNALFAAKPSKNPGSGAVVQAQLWYRDPLNTSNQTTSLSNAIEFCVGP